MLKKKIENKQSRLRLVVIMLALVMTVTGCSDSSFHGDRKLNGTWAGSYNGENLTLALYDGSFEVSFGNGSIMSGEYETDGLNWYYDATNNGYWWGIFAVENEVNQNIVAKEAKINFSATLAKGTIPRILYEFFSYGLYDGWGGRQYIINGNALTIYRYSYSDDYFYYNDGSIYAHPNGRENDDGREVLLTLNK